MRCFKILLLTCALVLLLPGCSSGAAGSHSGEAPDAMPAGAQEEVPPAEEREAPAVSVRPSKEEALAAREKALEGMSPEQIERLTQVVTAANLRLESGYLNDNLFEKLEDPDSLYWNCFDQTGEIQIGWSYDGSLDKDAVCREENLTEDAFYAQYGTRVVSNNPYAADDFIALMEELKADVRNESLKADLQYMADEMELAKDHVMEHVNNVYKTLHDLDYFLLRYGLEDFEMYSFDKSTVSKYYGTLSIYGTL